ncbi:MAG TPA: hypothetical protein VFA70_01330, partial [Dehalococcoidia bacterium]|nr:hypothetical protein [Dehalococcoidia bacterium]
MTLIRQWARARILDPWQFSLSAGMSAPPSVRGGRRGSGWGRARLVPGRAATAAVVLPAALTLALALQHRQPALPLPAARGVEGADVERAIAQSLRRSFGAFPAVAVAVPPAPASLSQSSALADALSTAVARGSAAVLAVPVEAATAPSATPAADAPTLQQLLEAQARVAAAQLV